MFLVELGAVAVARGVAKEAAVSLAQHGIELVGVVLHIGQGPLVAAAVAGRRGGGGCEALVTRLGVDGWMWRSLAVG